MDTQTVTGKRRYPTSRKMSAAQLRLRDLKQEATESKSRLIRILSEVETLNAGSARRLGKAIEKLEAWQNS